MIMVHSWTVINERREKIVKQEAILNFWPCTLPTNIFLTHDYLEFHMSNLHLTASRMHWESFRPTPQAWSQHKSMQLLFLSTSINP